MHKNRLFFVIILLTLCLGGISAATVTISVVQNEQAPEVALEISRTVENEIMMQFFDAGHIVSNEPIKSNGNRFPEKNYGLKDAALGYSDYLVVVFLQYGVNKIESSDKKSTYAELKSVNWRLVRVRNAEIITEKKLEIQAGQKNNFDPYKNAKTLAKQITVDLLKYCK
ncbi:hypothetical protein K7I13_01825 [Brucepastera parasyntrophica]|uniref:hypothetical protein n=1 Tax=Brucepastera parasyntrophica TaxID=2880008 RepID=UPI002109EFA7|nr:hypothetical protein [Brucepastera parasyntrophica]ULQ60092.1 hypothetical protein K7I13_01825 [Brucepastera parasyntrophica]